MDDREQLIDQIERYLDLYTTTYDVGYAAKLLLQALREEQED